MNAVYEKPSPHSLLSTTLNYAFIGGVLLRNGKQKKIAVLGIYIPVKEGKAVLMQLAQQFFF